MANAKIAPPPPRVVYHMPILANVRVERKEPQWQTFGPDDQNHLSEFTALLAAAGIADPTEATTLLDQAISLRRASRARAKPSEDPHAALVNRLASGDLTVERLLRELAKGPTTKALTEQQKESRAILASAGLSAFRAGCRAIREYGEAQWLKLVRTIVEQAIADGDQKTWVAGHRLGAFLRRREIVALARAVCDPAGRQELPLMHYMFARVDEVYRWQTSRSSHGHEMRNEHAGESARSLTASARSPIDVASIARRSHTRPPRRIASTAR